MKGVTQMFLIWIVALLLAAAIVAAEKHKQAKGGW
jgi:hypothetical protein